MSATEVYCTMVLTDEYVQGAAVLVSQLRQLDPGRRLVCLATPATLSPDAMARLSQLFDTVETVEPLVAEIGPEILLLNRPDLHMAITKFHLWTLDYSKIVYLDADTLPLQTLAPLFDTPLRLDGTAVAASPDAGWPDTFNSGVMVLRPNPAVFSELRARFDSRGSFDGADQGVLNEVLGWERLPFVYNVTINTAYEYAPAYERFKADVRLLHFIGAAKPWHSTEADSTGGARLWWDALRKANYHFSPGDNHSADSTRGGMTPAVAQALSEAQTAAQTPYDEEKVIAPAPDHWDARTHEPFRESKPEFSAPPTPKPVETALADLYLDPGFVHVFPKLGPALVKLPFEHDQRPAEREF